MATLKAIMAAITVGDLVTCKTREEGYGSNYAGSPTVFLEPGEVAVVTHVDVPFVYRTTGKSASFVKVERFIPGVYHFHATHHCTNQVWGFSIDYYNVVKVADGNDAGMERAKALATKTDAEDAADARFAAALAHFAAIDRAGRSRVPPFPY